MRSRHAIKIRLSLGSNYVTEREVISLTSPLEFDEKTSMHAIKMAGLPIFLLGLCFIVIGFRNSPNVFFTLGNSSLYLYCLGGYLIVSGLRVRALKTETLVISAIIYFLSLLCGVLLSFKAFLPLGIFNPSLFLIVTVVFLVFVSIIPILCTMTILRGLKARKWLIKNI